MNRPQTASGAGRQVSAGIAQLCALPRQLSRWLDRHAQTLAPAFLRLLLAYEFGEAGLEKLHGENWFADLNFPFPFDMLPAEWRTLSELWQDYAISDQGHGNYKLPLMYLFMLSALLCDGAGRLSIDHRLRRRPVRD